MILVVLSIVSFFLASIFVDWRVGVPLLAAAIFNFVAFDIFEALASLTNDVVLWYASLDMITAMILMVFGGRGFILQTVLLVLAAMTHMVLYVDVLVGSNFVYNDYEAIIYGITIAQILFIWRGGYEHGFINNSTHSGNPHIPLFGNRSNNKTC